MTTHVDPDRFPEEVVVDSYVLKDACWLLTSVEEFASRLRRRIEAAR